MQQPSKYNKKRNRLADIEDKLVITGGRGKWGGARLGKGIKMYKLVCVK